MTTGQAYGGEEMLDYEENINWDTVGVPVSLGKYNVIVEKAEYKPTSTKKHMVKPQFKIEGFDPSKPELEDMIGRTIFSNFVFTQGAAFAVKGFASVAVDANGEAIDLPLAVNKAVLEEWAASIVGARCAVEVKHRMFNEQQQAEISKWHEWMEIEETDDTSGGDGDVEEEEEPEAAADSSPELEEEEEIEAAPAKRSLREALPAKKTANGHTNGHTNGKSSATKSSKTLAKKSSRR